MISKGLGINRSMRNFLKVLMDRELICGYDFTGDILTHGKISGTVHQLRQDQLFIFPVSKSNALSDRIPGSLTSNRNRKLDTVGEAGQVPTKLRLVGKSSTSFWIFWIFWLLLPTKCNISPDATLICLRMFPQNKNVPTKRSLVGTCPASPTDVEFRV